MRAITIITVLFMLLFAGGSSGAQGIYPGHSQYLTNGMVINPAYAGSRGIMSTLFSIRKQWTRVEGAPLFQSASIHAPLKNDRVALGFIYHGSSYGVTNRQSFYGVYAYHLHLGSARLSFGLQGGADLTNSNFGSVNTTHPDPVFQDASDFSVLPNVGTGVYLYSDQFFLGLSVPAILSYKESASPSFSDLYYSHKEHDLLFLTGGLISFSEMFRLKPSTLFKFSAVKPVEIDINLNFIIADILWLGGSWRVSEEALIGIVELQLAPWMKVGYSYDYMMGNLTNFSSGSHELLMRFEFGYRVSATSPRYF